MAHKSRKKGKEKKLGGELLRNAREAAAVEQRWHIAGDGKPPASRPRTTNTSTNSPTCRSS